MILAEKSIIVVGDMQLASQQQSPDVTEEISKIASVVNALKMLIYPIQWVQTCIPILPFELIDILDAPMPFMVGILNEQWQAYLGQSTVDALADKCVIEIHPYNGLIIKFFDFEVGEINSNDPNNKLGSELFEMVGPAAFQKLGQQFGKLTSSGGKGKSQSDKLQNRRVNNYVD